MALPGRTGAPASQSPKACLKECAGPTRLSRRTGAAHLGSPRFSSGLPPARVGSRGDGASAPAAVTSHCRTRFPNSARRPPPGPFNESCDSSSFCPVYSDFCFIFYCILPLVLGTVKEVAKEKPKGDVKSFLNFQRIFCRARITKQENSKERGERKNTMGTFCICFKMFSSWPVFTWC